MSAEAVAAGNACDDVLHDRHQPDQGPSPPHPDQTLHQQQPVGPVSGSKTVRMNHLSGDDNNPNIAKLLRISNHPAPQYTRLLYPTVTHVIYALTLFYRQL